VGIDLLHPGLPGIAVAGVFGLLLGSFLNVCILAWGAEPKGSITRRRSSCPKCAAQIAWYDNIPVVSWIVLGARCRNCKEPIAIMYPLVEAATGIIWGFFAWRHGLTLEMVMGAVFFTLLLGIAVTDARAYIIPDEFSVGGMPLGLALAWAVGGTSGLTTSIIGAAVGFGVLWLVGYLGSVLLKQEAMGGGDIKMMGMVGAFVGWTGVVLTIFLGALIGTFIFLPLSLMGRKQLVPFGIFLALGAAIASIWGPALINWYTSTYLVG
jgi:leader peptidase (prepilin peptidase)/N-methyltransferase